MPDRCRLKLLEYSKAVKYDNEPHEANFDSAGGVCDRNFDRV